MRLRNYIRFSFEFFTKNMRQMLASTLIMSMGIVLITFAFVLLYSTKFEKNKCNEILRYKNEGTGYLVCKDKNDEEIKQILRNLEKQDLEYGYLDRVYVGMEVLSDLISEQNKLPYYINNNTFSNNSLDCVLMSPNLWNMFNLNLSEGEVPENNMKDNEIYLYVGANFDVDIGKEYELKNTILSDEFGQLIKDDNGEYVRGDFKIVIRGKLKDKENIMSPSITENDDYIQEATVNLNNLVIMVSNNPVCHKVYNRFIFSESYKNFREKLDYAFSESTRENGVGYGTIEHIFNNIDDRNKDTITNIIRLVVILMFSVVIIQGCSQVADIMFNTKEYGIYFANGFTKVNIYIIMLIETLWKFLLSASVAIIAGVLFAKYYFYDIQLFEYVMNLVCGGVMVKALAIAAGVLLIAQMIPMINE